MKESFLLEVALGGHCGPLRSSRERLTPERLKLAVAAVSSCARIRALYGGRVKIAFTGGEPLKEYGLLREAIENIRSSEPGFRVEVVTGGDLLTGAMADFFVRSGVEVCIALDGRKKPPPSGVNSAFGIASAALKRALGDPGQNLRFHALATLSSGTIAELPRVAEILRLKEGFKHLEIALDPAETWSRAGILRLRAVLRRLRGRALPGAGACDGEAGFRDMTFSLYGAADCGGFDRGTVTLLPDGYFYPSDLSAGAPPGAYRVGNFRAGIDFGRLGRLAASPVFSGLALSSAPGPLSQAERYCLGAAAGYAPGRLSVFLENAASVNSAFCEEMGGYARLQELYSRLYLAAGFGDFAHPPKYRGGQEGKALVLAVDGASDPARLRRCLDYFLYSPGQEKELVLEAAGRCPGPDLLEGLAFYSMTKSASLKKRTRLVFRRSAINDARKNV